MQFRWIQISFLLTALPQFPGGVPLNPSCSPVLGEKTGPATTEPATAERATTAEIPTTATAHEAPTKLTINRQPAEGDVRLHGGNSFCSGRVEVFLRGQWGTVCDDDWDLNDAQVVCTQTGCGTALSAPQQALFGQGSGPIWLDEVSCRGHESGLSECGHRGTGNQDCGHHEDAGVVCEALVRLVSSDSRCSGRVEVFLRGQWGVCGHDWDMNDAQVVCTQTGCGTALSAHGGALFGQGTGPIWVGAVRCRGHESSLSECGHRGTGGHNCSHHEDAGVVCAGEKTGPATTEPATAERATTADIPTTATAHEAPTPNSRSAQPLDVFMAALRGFEVLALTVITVLLLRAQVKRGSSAGNRECD